MPPRRKRKATVQDKQDKYSDSDAKCQQPPPAVGRQNTSTSVRSTAAGENVESSCSAKSTEAKRRRKVKTVREDNIIIDGDSSAALNERGDRDDGVEVEEDNMTKTARLLRSFYDQPCVHLARKLLGKRLVSHLSDTGRRLSGIIVETEAYVGVEDKASCSYGGRRTATIEAVYMAPGTAFVYNTYGMWTCINISSQGDGAAVLIRALEPTEGLDEMRRARIKPGKERKLEDFDLCNGPAKLTKSLNILKANANQVDTTTSKHFWLEDGLTVDEKEIVSCSRIGIARAGEWTNKPLRFYIFGNKCVSKRDKQAESSAGFA